MTPTTQPHDYPELTTNQITLALLTQVGHLLYWINTKGTLDGCPVDTRGLATAVDMHADHVSFLDYEETYLTAEYDDEPDRTPIPDSRGVPDGPEACEFGDLEYQWELKQAGF